MEVDTLCAAASASLLDQGLIGQWSIPTPFLALSRHRASRISYPWANRHHWRVACIAQIRLLRHLARTDGDPVRHPMMNCNVAGLPHPPDLRYVVSPIHRQHHFGFDYKHPHPIYRKWAACCGHGLLLVSLPLNPIFPFPPDVVSAHPMHRRPAQHLQRLCHDCTTTAVRCSSVFPTSFLPVFMVNWPVSDDVAELVADNYSFSSLPTYFPDLPAHPK